MYVWNGILKVAPSAGARRSQLVPRPLVMSRRPAASPRSVDPHRLSYISPLIGKEARSNGLLRGRVSSVLFFRSYAVNNQVPSTDVSPPSTLFALT